MKRPRSFDGKTCRHHWFKNSRVLLRLAIDQIRGERERKRIAEAHKEPMYPSVKEAFGASLDTEGK